MIKKVYSAIILLSLATPALVVAADSAEVHGMIELGARGVDNNTDSALFQEFRDLDDGAFGQLQLDAFKKAYHFQFDAEVAGADDQSFQLKGGHYGSFKYQFNYDEMPHNYLFDAITPAAGVGTDHFIFPTAADADATPLSDWTHFDYAVEHKTYGGEVEVSLHSPFYVKAGVDRHEQNGLRPFSVKIPAEVPEPISNKTDNLNLKGGYLGEALSASITGSLSSFNNDYHSLYYDPLTDSNTVGLPPDNTYNKLAADLSWRQLPLGSVLAVGGSYAHLENDFSASDFRLDSVTWGDFASLNRTQFSGDVDYTNASIALTSQPISKLDTKLYYRYLDRDDSSSIITYGDPLDPTSNAQEDFQKNDAGFDIGYRLPNKTKLEAGYEYLNVDRSVTIADQATGGLDSPADETQDDSVYIQVKNSTLDWMTAKVRYKHLERDSDELLSPTTPSLIPTPFYYLDQANDEWKLGLEFYPLDRLDLGLDFSYKNTDYDHAIDTRQNDIRRNVYLDATWRAAEMATLTGFVGFEKVETDANRVTDNADPSNTSYTQTIDDDFWAYGLAANVAATNKLTFNLSWQYQESDGEVSFADNIAGGPLFNINNSDDYTKKQLAAKAIYAIDPKLKMTLGYLYEKFEYQDINTDNYEYQPDPARQYFYSGLNANPDYEANVGYLMATYGF